MKIAAVLLTVFCIHASANGYSQGITLSVKNVRLEKVFEEIQKQGQFKFVYKVEILNEAKPVDLNVKGASLRDVLDLCFKDQPLSYTIIDDIIVVSKKERKEEKPDVVGASLVDVRGKVVNEKGEAVSGATVSVKGTSKLTTANENGEFFLNGVGVNDILVVSHIGFEEQEIKVAGKPEIIVQLKLSYNQLNTVTISNGIVNLKTTEPGSFSYVNNDQLNEIVSTDILSRLKRNGTLLFDPTVSNNLGVRIRSMSTINANSQPLIILDNFPYDGNIDEINPNDVEDVTILKDAGASSLWGARSGNGVIVITTKKGRYNQPVAVEFNMNATVGMKPDLFYDKQFLNSDQFINVETFLFNNGYYNADLLNTITFPPFSPVVELLSKRRAGLITPGDSAAQVDALRRLDIRDEYSKYFYQPALKQQYVISLRGGSNKANYYLSAGYDKNRSNVVRDDYERISLNVTTTYSPVKNLELSGQIVYTQTTANNNGMSEITARGNYTNIYPYAQLADAEGAPLSVIKDYRSSFALSPPVSGLLNWEYYPLEELRLNNRVSKNFNTRIKGNVKYTIIKGFTAEVIYQYLHGIGQNHNLNSAESYTVRNLVNKYSSIVNNAVSKRNIPTGDMLSNGSSNLISKSLRTQLGFNNRWKNHTVSAVAGIDVLDTRNDGVISTNYGYDSDIGTSIPVNFDSLYLVYPTNSRSLIGGAPEVVPYTIDRFISYFTNVSYNFANRYTFSASARSDQSNLFGVKTNQKKNPIWSAGFKWSIDNEDFYKISTWLPSLKFRVTYGFNGNISKSITAFTTAQTTKETFNNFPAALITSPGNPELRWEKTGTLNLGLDFEIGKRSLQGSIEYYHRSGVDMIGDAAIPSSTGFISTRGNFSSMVGHGFEFMLNTKNIKSNRNISWETTFSFNCAFDRVTKNEGRTLAIPGRPVAWVYSYKWMGLDAGGDPLGVLGDTLSKAYSTIAAKANADPRFYIYSGPATPQFYGNIENTFTWKGIELSANIVYKAGYYFRRNSISYSSLYNGSIGHVDFIYRWQKPGDEAITNVPSMVFPENTARDNFYNGSEVLVEKADHIRLQDIGLRYGIDNKKWKRLPLSYLQFYCYINNVGILWTANDKGIDPNAISGYPAPLTISLGVKAKL